MRQLGWMAIVLLGIPVLFFFARQNYIFFHSLVEIGMVAVSLSVVLVAFNARNLFRDSFFNFLSISLFFSAILELLHAFTYKGMVIFPGLTANEPTQLWLAFRYLWALSLFLAPLISLKLSKTGLKLIAAAYAGVTALIIYSILGSDIFPAAFQEGRGLTGFKVASEYLTSLILVLAMVFLYQIRERFDQEIFFYLIRTIGFSILAGLAFTLYVDVYGFFNFLGHILLAISTVYFYRAMLKKTVSQPMSFLFRELDQANQKLTRLSNQDGLTGLFNRRKVLEEGNEKFLIARRFQKPFVVMMIDIDNFKDVNDTFGHLVGDGVIREFGALLQKSFRSVDLVGRYGGDEFLVSPLEMEMEKAEEIVRNIIKRLVEEPIEVEGRKIKITASAGICELRDQRTFMELVNEADNLLLQRKSQGKNGLNIGVGRLSGN